MRESAAALQTVGAADERSSLHQQLTWELHATVAVTITVAGVTELVVGWLVGPKKRCLHFGDVLEGL